jgi:Glycosyl hydrolases family 28
MNMTITKLRVFAIAVIVAIILHGAVSAGDTQKKYQIGTVTVATKGFAGDSEINILDHGVVGDGKRLNTTAIEKAIQACASRGGGRVLFPQGEYLTGTFELLSNVTLHLEEGAVIKGSANLDDYSGGDDGRLTLIIAFGEENVAITGSGAIDGNGMAFMTNRIKGMNKKFKQYSRQGKEYMDPKFGTEHGPLAPKARPKYMIYFNNCRNVLITGVTIRNAPFYHVQIKACANVDVAGVYIHSHGSDLRIPNDDGINFSNCNNVNMHDCNIQTGDDCIAVYGGGVTVSNCTLSSRSSAIRVGYTSGARNCTFRNLVIYSSHRGLNVCLRGEETIENILFSDIHIKTQLYTGGWWGKSEPIHVSAIPFTKGNRGVSLGGNLGKIKNVRFLNIVADSENGILVYGYKEGHIQDLLFDNIKLTLKGGPLQKSYGGNFDLMFNNIEAENLFKHDIPGMYCRYVDGLKINGFKLAWDDNLPEFFNHGIHCEFFKDVVIDGFEGRQPHIGGDAAAIALNDGSGITIRNSKADKDTGTFLSHSDITDEGLFANNDLSNAQEAIEPENSAFEFVDNLWPAKKK